MGLGDELPEEIVGGLPGSLPPIGTSHHKVARPIVQDGVNVDVSSNPADSELVDIGLPEGVDVAPLEPLE
jgi:hypothetical protein